MSYKILILAVVEKTGTSHLTDAPVAVSVTSQVVEFEERGMADAVIDSINKRRQAISATVNAQKLY